MKEKKYSIRKVWLVLAASLLAGCAQAPEQSAVGQKNVKWLAEAVTAEDREERQLLSEQLGSRQESGSLESEPNETEPADTLFAPPAEHYTFFFESGKDGLTVRADAPVLLPKKGQMPSYRVACRGWTQEQAAAIYRLLFQGEKTYRTEGSDFTKSRAEEMMLQMQEEISQIRNREGDFKDLPPESAEDQIGWRQEYLQQLQEEYDELPEESTLRKVEVDSTFRYEETTDSELGTVQVEELFCETENGSFLNIVNADPGAGFWPSLAYQRGRQTPKTEAGAEAEDPDAGVPLYYSLGESEKVGSLEEAGERLSMDLGAAKAQAEAFLQAAGAADARLMRVALAKGYYFREEDDDEGIVEDTPSAVELLYGRVIEGLPVAVTTSNQLPEDEAALLWCYEGIQILLDEDGISSINWQFPLEITETLTEDTAILPWEAARRLFEEQVPLLTMGRLTDFNGTIISEGDLQITDSKEAEKAKDTTMTMEVLVSRVELNLMRVRDSGRERTGLYVPAWVFYGSESRHFHNDRAEEAPEEFPQGADWESQEKEPWIIFAVNAVDGTPIDLVEGY